MKLLIKSGLIIALLAGLSVSSSPLWAVDDMKNWQTSLIRKLQESHIYPRSAIRKEIEGRALVNITINRAGEILEYTVVESAGNDVLDKTIPKMVEKLNPLPEPPSSISDANLTFTVPVTWRLQ